MAVTVHFPERIRETLRGSTLGPALALFAALSTVFLFGEHRSYFYWDYDWVSSQNMAIAANLSVDHGFLGFLRQTIDGAGAVTYQLYNRFPIGTYVALKLAMLPFEGDLSAQIFAAKTLTVCFFCAAAVAAWLALSRILCDRWSAAAAVLLAFSSYPMLYHADMVGEGFVDVFGVMLAFHGMTVFVQEGRFRQLAIKTCIALTLGWHTVGLIAAFVLFGIAGDVWRLFRSVGKAGAAPGIRPVLRWAAENTWMRYGAFSLGFALVLLACNFFNEYRAFGGETAVTELPSVESMSRRVGAAGERLEQRTDQQLHLLNLAPSRIDSMTYPYATLDRPAGTVLRFPPTAPLDGSLAGFLAIGACLVGLLLVTRWRGRLALAALAALGCSWIVIVPFTAYHPFETIFFVGVLFAGWSAVLHGLRRLAGSRTPVAATAVAATVFGISCLDMKYAADPSRHMETTDCEIPRSAGHDAESVRTLRAIPGDFDAIREKMPKGSIVRVVGRGEWCRDWGARYALDFYLPGYILIDGPVAGRIADFVLTQERMESAALLTPENKEVFLYDRALYDERPRQRGGDAFSRRAPLTVRQRPAPARLEVRRKGRHCCYRRLPHRRFVAAHLIIVDSPLPLLLPTTAASTAGGSWRVSAPPPPATPVLPAVTLAQVLLNPAGGLPACYVPGVRWRGRWGSGRRTDVRPTQER